jgi:hypothetical protein
MEYYFNGFQNYLATLSTKHKLLKHDTTPGGQKSFIRFQSEEDLNELSNNPSPNLVTFARFYGKAIGDADDEKIRQYALIRFSSYAPRPLDGTITEEITNAIDRAFGIMMQFVARMRQDMRQDCGPLDGLELENFSFDEIPDQPFLEHHYGWELTIPFRSDAPPLDPDQWEPDNI